jgi:hypothetical protein
VQIALYIALGLLAAIAVGMQVWLMRSASGALPDSRRSLASMLRMLNIGLLVAAAAIVAYALVGR